MSETAATEAPSLGRSTAIMAAGTLLSRVTGFGRVFALAYALGASRLTDTYTLANNTPNIIYELVLGGVLSGTLLPVFVSRLRTEKEEDAWRSISAVWTVALVALVMLSVAFVFVAPWFVRLYTLRNQGDVAEDQLAVATTLLRLFAPQVAMYGLVSMTTALLRAHHRFAAPMFAPVLNNLVVIGVLLAFPHFAGTTDLDAVRGDTGALMFLGLGTTAGIVAMTIAQFPFGLVRRHIRWVWDPRNDAVRTVLRLSGWTIGFVIANQIALFFVQFLANGRSGDVTVYSIAYIFFLLPHGVVAVSIISALSPQLAERFAAQDASGFRNRFSLGLRSIWAVTVPAGAGMALLAAPIVSVVLEHGALSGAGASRIGDTLALMALGLPGFSAYLFIVAVYQARQDTKSLFFLYLIENAINVAAAFALYPAFGVRGLAAALAIAYSLGTVAALLHLRRRAGGLDGPRVGGSALRIGVATAAMAAAAALAVRAVADYGSLIETLVGVGAGGSVYLAAARLLGIDELTVLLPTRTPRRHS